MTRLEIYKECVSEFGIDPALMDEYVVSQSYNPLTDGDPDEEVAEDVIAEIRAEWMPIIADWVRRSEEKKRNYVLPHAPNETNEPRTRTAMTRREIIKQAAAEFGIEDEFVDTLLASENPELLEVQLAFDEELSEDEAKCVRNLWMNHYSSMREATAASTDKARTGANCPDKQSRERDRWMRLTKMTIIPVAVAAVAGFVGGYNSRAPNHPANIASSPGIRRAIPVEPEIRKAIPVHTEKPQTVWTSVQSQLRRDPTVFSPRQGTTTERPADTRLPGCAGFPARTAASSIASSSGSAMLRTTAIPHVRSP